MMKRKVQCNGLKPLMASALMFIATVFAITPNASWSQTLNDDCLNATVVNTLPFRDQIDTRLASPKSNDPVLSCADGGGGNTVWYVMTPISDTFITINTRGSSPNDYDTALAVFTGNCSNLVEIICNDDIQLGVVRQSEIFLEVEAGKTYYILVAEWNGGGPQGGNPTGGDLILTIEDTTPQSPRNLIATVDAAQIKLTWTPNSETDLLRYRIYRDVNAGAATLFDSVAAGANTYVDSTLATNTVYTYRITALDSALNESGFSNQVTGFIAELPDLKVTRIQSPPSASSGQPIQIDWVVTNTGNDGTKAPLWHDDLYLSPTDSLDLSTATFLGRVENFSALNSGEGYANSATYTLPRGISGGYSIFVRTDVFNRERESDETNNLTRSDPVQIDLSPSPDLRITTIIAPDDVFSGQSMQISWTVENKGTGKTDITNWFDTIFLSADSTFDFDFIGSSNIRINETQLKVAAHKGVLDPGGSYTATATVQIPQAIFGEHHFFVYTDIKGGATQSERGSVYEYIHEQNNWLADSVIIRLTPPPDLEVTAASAPDSASLGEEITVQWTVSNNGAGEPFETGWSDRVYLSHSAVFHLDSIIALGSFRRNGMLQPGSSDTRSGNVRIPGGFVGEKYIFVETDWNNGVFEFDREDNNVLPEGAPIILQTPDLVVDAIEIPATGSSGKRFEIGWTVRNEGAGGVFNHSWNDRAYFSRQPVFDPDSVAVLGSFARSGTLAAGDNYSVRRTFTLPNGISGDFYIFVETDWNQRIFEPAGEENNRRRSLSAMSVELSPWPDLQVASVQAATNFTAGDRIAITWTVANNGVAATENASWTDRVYLSPGATYDPGNAILLTGVGRSRGLEPQTRYTQSRTVTLAASLSGTYCIAVVTDADNAVYEHTDEGNNLLHSEVIQIASYPPIDLAVSGLTAPDSAFSGTVISLQWKVENLGQGATLASGWQDRVWLSSDATLEPGSDLLYATTNRSGVLRPGQHYLRNTPRTLPNGFSGDYFIIVEIDAGGAVGDVNRSNNLIVSTRPMQIALAPSPDLTIIGLSLPDSAAAGQPLIVAYTVENRGDGTTANAAWYDAIFLSTNTTLDAGDKTLVTRRRNLSLAPNSGYSDSVEVEMPGFAAGTFFLIAKTDSRNDIYEHNGEHNNIRVGDTTSVAGVTPIVIIQPLPADLIVSDITLPQNAVPGQEATIAYTLKNIGENRARGRLRDAVYISADTLWQVEDPLFGVNTHTIDLAPDSAMQISMQIDLAKAFRADAEGNITEELPGLTPGSYHAIVRTDIRRNIRESNPNNNRLTSTDLMSTDVPELQLGVPATGTLAGGEMRYFRLESVEAGATIQIDLTGSDSTAFNELYIALDRTPTLNDFDFAAIKPYKANQRVVIPSSESGEYFLMLNSRAASGSNTQFTLLADSLEFAIHSVETNVGGNTGQVTVKLTGAKFDSLMIVYLRKDSTTIVAHDYIFTNQASAFASFDLVRAEPGIYDLQVENLRGDIATLPNGFEVVPGTDELLSIEETFPSFARSGQIVTITVNFLNQGNIDIPRSISILTNLSGTPIAYSPDNLQFNFHSVYIDLREANGPRDVLRPGAGGSVVIFAKAEEDLRLELFKPLVTLDQNIQQQSFSTNADVNVSGSGCPVNWFGGLCSCVPDLIFSPSCLIHDLCYGTCGSIKIICDLVFLNNMISQCHLAFNSDGLEFKICKGFALIYFAGVVVVGDSFFEDAQAEACQGAGPLPDYSPVTPLPLIPKDRPCPAGSKCWEIPIKEAIDPNDITGPAGEGDARWITATETLPYAIRFENDSTKATAAAQVVSITQKLDSTLDSRSFRLGSFDFANHTFTAPENRAFYSTRLDVRDSLGVFVDLTAGIDLVKNEAFWIFKAIDPATGQLPVFDGFLPVNDALHRGEGFVNYSIRPQATAETGDVIRAQARIVFDSNAPLDTPEIFNTIDAVIPHSKVAALPAALDSTTFTLHWAGMDDSTGSQIRSFDVYVAENSGPFELFESGLLDTSLVFSGDFGSAYSFFTLATDIAGNAEPLKSIPDATVTLDPTATSVAAGTGELPKTFALYQNYPNPFNPTTTFRYDLPIASEVKLVIYNILGRKVRTLVDKKLAAGSHTIQWDGRNAAGMQVATGMYIYRIEAGDASAGAKRQFVQTRKMLLLR